MLIYALNRNNIINYISKSGGLLTHYFLLTDCKNYFVNT